MKVDYFVYNGQDVVPMYLPGIPSYGQEGTEGNVGDTGSSVHYSSYDIHANLQTCNELINKGKTLSNNLNEVEEPEYLENDIVIDCIGSIWKIKSDVISEKFYLQSSDSNYSNSSNAFYDFNVICTTSYMKSSQFKNFIEREADAVEEYSDSNSSPKVYHHYKYEPYVYGNWITFSLSFSKDYSYGDYYFKYVLVLPNGEQLSMTSDKPAILMFLENSLFYSCALDYDYNVDEYLSSSRSININEECIGSGNYTYKITTKSSDIQDTPQFVYDIDTLDPTTQFNYMHYGVPIKDLLCPNTNKGYYDESVEDNKKERLEFVSIAISRFINENCTAYVEAYHRSSGKIYRLDVNDIFLSSQTNLTTGEIETSEIDGKIPYIVPSIPFTQWVVHEYDRFLIDPSEYSSSGDLLSTADKRYKRMDCYMIYNSPKDNDTAEDNKQQDFYFIDCTGIQNDYVSYDDEENANVTYYHGSYMESNLAHEIPISLKDVQRTIRLKFMNLNSLNITLQYNSISSLNFVAPSTMIYIGVPDCELISFGDNIKDPQDSKKFIDKGIYYLHKFIPFNANNENTEQGAKTVNVGKAVMTINLSEFSLSPNTLHYIEIGAVPLNSLISPVEEDLEENPEGRSTRADVIKNNNNHRLSFTPEEQVEAGMDYSCYDFSNNTLLNSGTSDITLIISEITDIGETVETSKQAIQLGEEHYKSFTEGMLDSIFDEEGNSILEVETH